MTQQEYKPFNLATMGKTALLVQAAFAALFVIWTLFMTVRMLTGDYDAVYTVCFGLMSCIGYNFLAESVKEMRKGGEK